MQALILIQQITQTESTSKSWDLIPYIFKISSQKNEILAIFFTNTIEIA